MTDHDNKFVYPWYGAELRARFTAIAILLMIGMGTALLVGGVITNDLATGEGLALILLIVCLTLYGTVVCNVYPNIYVSDYGLGVQVFIFWRKWVPWNEVLAAVSFSGSRWGREWLILVNRLTPFHRLIGLFWGKVNRPGFLITMEMKNVFRLVELIEGCLAESEGNISAVGR